MTTEFEEHRSFLSGLAYRMLGSVADAEGIVQDAFLRWREADHKAIDHPRAYLARVVSRLCLDIERQDLPHCELLQCGA